MRFFRTCSGIRRGSNGNKQKGVYRNMKHQYFEVPESMKNLQAWGFNWLEFVTSVPAPMFLVTSRKSNGRENACMQSWACFSTADHAKHYCAILSSVNKNGHLYRTLQESGEAVINFLSADLYEKAMDTIRNNDWDRDEITVSGLTAVPAAKVNAPMVDECFMNLECRFLWEKEIIPGDDHVIVCLDIVNVHVDEDYLNNRVAENGMLYNIHHPINPETFPGKAHDYAGIVKPILDIGEY